METGSTGIEIRKIIVVKSKNVKKIGLPGTKFTVELDFFKFKLKDKGTEAVIPGEEDRSFIHYTIFEELGLGQIKKDTKQHYLSIINRLIQQGAEGIILGCTENATFYSAGGCFRSRF